MTASIQRRYQDIAIIKFEKETADQPKDRRNPIAVILATVLITVLLIAVGYFACLRAGFIAPPDDGCCFGIIDLDFDFDASNN